MHQVRGLVYLNNRHYDPTTGVFLSVDPLVVKTGEPYIYGAANPIRFSDPDGLETCDTATGICWDDYEDFTRGSVYAKTRGAYAEAGVRPKVTYDKNSDTTIYENIPAALQGVLTEKEGVAWNAGAAIGTVDYQFFNGIKNHNVGAGWDLPKGWGISIEFCVISCVEVGSHNKKGFLSVGGLGLGASVNFHVTSQGSCDQQGWSQGGSYVPGIGGGGSVSTPLDGFWSVDAQNVDAYLSLGARYSGSIALPGSAGTTYTWVSGC